LFSLVETNSKTVLTQFLIKTLTQESYKLDITLFPIPTEFLNSIIFLRPDSSWEHSKYVNICAINALLSSLMTLLLFVLFVSIIIINRQKIQLFFLSIIDLNKSY
jgi:hypothetical protein